jgi:hypothetical protein
MDVPPPEEEDEDGDGLSIEEADEKSIRQRLRRRRPRVLTVVSEEEEEQQEDEVMVEAVLEAVEEAREKKRAHTAPHRSREEKMRDQRLDPAFVIEVEMAIMRPLLVDMEVPMALAMASTLRAARMLVTAEDGLWKHWWHRDFPELERFLGADALYPPPWIMRAQWRDVVGQAIVEKRPLEHPALRMYYKMPWRCWYQWCEFFRRSALWHIAHLLNVESEEWIKPSMRMSARDPRWAGRPVTINRTRNAIDRTVLKVPRFSHGGVSGMRQVSGKKLRHGSYGMQLHRGSYLVAADNPNQTFNVDDLVMARLRATPGHNTWQILFAQDLHLPEAQNPRRASSSFRWHRFATFWLIELVMERSKQLKLNVATFWRNELGSRQISSTLSLGRAGTDFYAGGGGDPLSWGKPQQRSQRAGLNFPYAYAMQWFCTWYEAKCDPSEANPYRWAPFPPSMDHPLRTVETMLGGLPALPQIEGVWFVGDSFPRIDRMGVTVNTLPVAVGMRPLCVGCHSTFDLPLRCKTCKQGYCGTECHKQNWHRVCAGCMRKEGGK